MKLTKKISCRLLYVLLLIVVSTFVYSQPIPTNYWGLNAWMPANVGQSDSPGNGITPDAIVDNPGGSFYSILSTSTLIEVGGVKLLRYGGTAADVNIPTQAQYNEFVDACIAKGFTPVIQVSFLGKKLSGLSSDPTPTYYANYGPTDVVAIMTALENRGTPVKHWILGNEPDKYHNFIGGTTTQYDAFQIATEYFKPYAKALKAHAFNHVPSYQITIIGPELAEFDPFESQNTIMKDLLTTQNSSNLIANANITGFIKDEDASYPNSTDHYLDVASFHLYPYGSSLNSAQTVIDLPSGYFQSQLAKLSGTGGYLLNTNNKNPNLKVAVTEFNLCSPNSTTAAFDNTSFIAGQFMADMFATGMKNSLNYMVPWSTIEGTGASDHGLVSSVGNIPRSTYWHYKIVAEFFSRSVANPATFFEGTAVNISNTPINGLKAAGVKRDNEHYAILLMNQSATSYNFVADPSGNSTNINGATINIGMGSDCTPFTGTIPPNTTVVMKWDATCEPLGYYIYDETRATAVPPQNPDWISSTYVPILPHADITTVNATCAGAYANGEVHLSDVHGIYGAAGIVSWSMPNSGSSYDQIGLTPGSYWVTITNAGPGQQPFRTYKFTINGEFYSPKAISTNTNWNNYLKIGGPIRLKNGATLNINTPLIEFAPQGKIIVENGCTLNINQATLQSMAGCSATWQGIEVEAGGVLNMENGSLVKINGTGKISVDGILNLKTGATAEINNSGTLLIKAGGVINYSQGTTVNLVNNTSVMEIQGQLNIAANTIFKSLGNGYIKFNSPLTTSNITAGNGASMVFERNNNNQKALEVSQNALLAPTNLALFKVNKCKVELLSNGMIMPLGGTTQIIFTNSKLTSALGRGLNILGQPSVTINNSIFEGGLYGIYALLTQFGNPLTITNCTFEGCGEGLKSHDKSVNLNACKFYTCGTGWTAVAMSLPSVANNCIFGTTIKYNSTGIYYQGGANGTLFLNNCKVNGNIGDGVQIEGTMLKVKCGEIKDNLQNGIYLSNNASLNMSNDLGGGNVDLSNNGGSDPNYYTILLNNAKNMWLNNGFNNLSRVITEFSCGKWGTDCPMLIYGTMNIEYDPCGNLDCSPITIAANRNKWLDLPVVTPPRNYQEYQISTVYKCGINGGAQRTILLSDINPAQHIKCDDRIKHDRVLSLLDNCPTCPTINTVNFPGKKLNKAVESVLSLMEGVTPGDSKKAEELFYEILKYPIASPSVDTKNILELSYQLMLESMGQAYVKNELLPSVNTPNLGTNALQLTDIQDDLIIKYPCYEDRKELFVTSMEKAQSYRPAERRDLSIGHFNNIQSWADTDDQPHVQKWLCITNAEKDLKQGIIQPQDFESAIAQCGSTLNARSARVQDERISRKSIQTDLLTIAPNPATDKISVNYKLPTDVVSGTIAIKNMFGQSISTFDIDNAKESILIDCTTYNNGIYFISLVANGKIIESKKLVVTK